MIWVLLIVVALAVLAPVLLVLRGRGQTRGAKELALDLHRTQLRELDRDLAEGKILPGEHKTAVLEVQRRLLAAGAMAERPARAGARWPVVLTAVLVPLAGAALYWVSGAHPSMPSGAATPLARRAQEEAMIEMLRDRLAQMDPNEERTREGYRLLGRAEMSLGHAAEAAAAYRQALTGKFDALTAALAAEAATEAEGSVSAQSAALFRQALEAAPTAPWRPMVERRLAEATGK